MDFDTMLTKLDNEEYKCAQDFLDDIDLIAENAIAYNSDLNFETNKIICHRARALQDFCYALVKAEMDTDFEDECKVRMTLDALETLVFLLPSRKLVFHIRLLMSIFFLGNRSA
jgi:threonine dehydratase